jgi:hypothetical protein
MRVIVGKKFSRAGIAQCDRLENSTQTTQCLSVIAGRHLDDAAVDATVGVESYLKSLSAPTFEWLWTFDQQQSPCREALGTRWILGVARGVARNELTEDDCLKAYLSSCDASLAYDAALAQRHSRRQAAAVSEAIQKKVESVLSGFEPLQRIVAGAIGLD